MQSHSLVDRHRRLAWLPPAGVLALVLAGCAPHPQTTLAPESDYAQNIQNLFALTFWAAVGVFLIVGGMLVFAVIRFRGRPGDPRPALLPGHRNLEIAWTAAPVVILMFIGVPTVGLIFQSGGPAPSNAVQVTAIGHQWWFEFQYPDQHIVTANEMHIPTGRAVNIALKSADVIHSFWIPKLAGKRDMIPNHTNYIWFTPERTGIFYGECAEFCGISHANMGFRVVVDTPAAYAAWLAAQQRPAAAPSGAQAQAGAQTFLSSGCAGCHTIAGANAKGTIGPNLTHVGSRLTLAAGLLPNDAADLQHWLANPGGIKPGNQMAQVVTPGMLTTQQQAELSAYLENLK
jgi:cytochrome c oxidase subunit 2